MLVSQNTVKNKSDYALLSIAAYFVFICIVLCFYMCFIFLVDFAYFSK